MRERDPGRMYAAVLALSSVVFAAIAGAVLFWEQADRLDVQFVNWVRRTPPDLLVEVMEVLTYAGSFAILGPLAVVAGVLLVRRKQAEAAGLVISATLGSQFLSQGLKAGFQRGRPEFEDPFVQLTTYAFPSGHAFGATATYGALALVLARGTDTSRRVALLLVATVLILVVAASRVIVGRHYLLDVSAGIAGGVALLCALLLLLQRVRRPGLPLEPFARNQQPQGSRLDA